VSCVEYGAEMPGQRNSYLLKIEESRRKKSSVCVCVYVYVLHIHVCKQDVKKLWSYSA
jgi:hypothetical protein